MMPSWPTPPLPCGEGVSPLLPYQRMERHNEPSLSSPFTSEELPNHIRVHFVPRDQIRDEKCQSWARELSYPRDEKAISSHLGLLLHPGLSTFLRLWEKILTCWSPRLSSLSASSGINLIHGCFDQKLSYFYHFFPWGKVIHHRQECGCEPCALNKKTFPLDIIQVAITFVT